MILPSDIMTAKVVRPSDFPPDIWAVAEFVVGRLKLMDGEPDVEKAKLVAVAISAMGKR
jgi:hypothetical protein